MHGVTLALRLALGLPHADPDGRPLIEHETERVRFTDGTEAHLFECFAMANLLLCSAVPKPGSQKSLANAVMRANYVRHLVATVRILQPTLVVSQGWTLVDTLWDALCVTHEVDLDPDGCHLTYCDLDGDRFVWVALKHPTRLRRSATQAYLSKRSIQQSKKHAVAVWRSRESAETDARTPNLLWRRSSRSVEALWRPLVTRAGCGAGVDGVQPAWQRHCPGWQDVEWPCGCRGAQVVSRL
jgi:hypothetical protein